MPTPFFNVLNGGKHSGNPMAFQECMIAPGGAKSITQAVEFGSEVYQALKTIITQKFGSAGKESKASRGKKKKKKKRKKKKARRKY